MAGLTFTVWDVGGQKKIRQLWHHYFIGAHGKLQFDFNLIVKLVLPFRIIKNQSHIIYDFENVVHRLNIFMILIS